MWYQRRAARLESIAGWRSRSLGLSCHSAVNPGRSLPCFSSGLAIPVSRQVISYLYPTPNELLDTVGTFGILAQSVLVITAAVLIHTAVADLKHYQIKNEIILLLAGLFLVYTFLSNTWTSLYWNFGFALFLFLIMLIFYSRHMIGGGDLKLLTVTFLWTGPFCAAQFSVFLLIFVGLHTLAAKLGFVEMQLKEGRRSIAFAPSIAAALIAVFLSGCLNN